MENITATHPIATLIAAWFAMELAVYVLVSLAIVWRHLRHGFSWPVRAIRAARYFSF